MTEAIRTLLELLRWSAVFVCALSLSILYARVLELWADGGEE